MTNDIIIPALARVEGEGALYIHTKDGQVDDIKLNIYEPPRFFEGFLLGRHFQEVPDITARICGICPVAYQMSSVKALEQAYDVQITPDIRSLRRLLYCAEYVESHALHIYMLQAPDLLGKDSIIEVAEIAPEMVKKALKLKKIGNNLLKTIGGRSVHPVNTKVGGFYRWPEKFEINALLDDFKWALQASIETVQFAASLDFPKFEMDYEFVALSDSDEYAVYDGEIISSLGRKVSAEAFETVYLESQVIHSTALHSHTVDGNPYFVGPLARLNLNFDKLRPIARKAAEEIGLELPLKNPYKSLIARAIELVEVCEVAIELIQAYNPQGPSYTEAELKNGEGFGVSEAPRGILYHHYKVGADGFINFAKITPPTAQNYPRIEADLWKLAPSIIAQPHKNASLACEHLIRSYDPCISCSTHFLKLNIMQE
jgi:coenzyme F420-reducing hydrogenase alpha subunit